MPTFCRHNRFFADCPICSKGTVLDPERQAQRRARPSPATRSGASGQRRKGTPAPGAARASRGPFASAGPYDGAEIRLEGVPGGLRMAAWRGGQIDRVAPVVALADLPALLGEAAEKELLAAGRAAAPAEPSAAASGGPAASPSREPAVASGEPAGASGEPAPSRAAEPGVYGASPGRAGELRDELRVERLDGERVRVARWIMRPNRGWELQEAPVMLPPERFAQALAAAAGKGVLALREDVLASEGPAR